MDFIIRPVEKKDLVILVELCQKHADYEKTSYTPDGKQELLGKALFSGQPKLFCLVMEVNQLIAGYATYTYDFSTWDAQTFLYLDCLYIEPDYRGFGVGESILKQLKMAAREKKCVTIQWQTPVFNTQAIKFYTRVGGIGKDKVRFFLNLQDDSIE